MTRAAPLLLLFLLAGCRKDAIHARVQIPRGLAATCIALDVLTSTGELRHTEQVVRPADAEDEEVNIAVFQGDLPRDVQLQARALWGTACEGSLQANGQSEPQQARFERQVKSVTLALSTEDDADGDGFLPKDKGGPDCDDTAGSRNPAAQEICDATEDRNCNGSYGCEDGICAAQVPRSCVWPTDSIAFTRSPASSIAGECSEAITVERLGVTGEPSRLLSDTSVTLEPQQFTAMVLLYKDRFCLSPLGSNTITIPARESAFSFYLKGSSLGSGRLEASAGSLKAMPFAHALVAGPTSKLLFDTPPLPELPAGACGSTTLRRVDRNDNPVTGPSETLALSGSGGVQFYQDANCTLVATQPSFAAGSPTRTLYFKSGTTGALTITVSLVGATSPVTNQQTHTVVPGPAAKLRLTPVTAQTLAVGKCSERVVVTLQDAFDNDTTLSAPASLQFASGGGVSVFADSQCLQAAPASFPARDLGGVAFYFKGANLGEASLSVTVASLPPQTLSATFKKPVVQRGQCTMTSDTTTCSIPFALDNLAQSFLVFQATATNASAQSTFVRCVLATPTTITCSRASAGTGTVTIAWQTAERSQGLNVQRVDIPCTAPPATSYFAPITNVDASKTFLLSSVSQGLGSLQSENLGAVRLDTASNPMRVEVTTNQNCPPSATFSVQVVQLDGLSVVRRETELAGETVEVNDLASVSTDRTLVLSTFKVGPTGSTVCSRMTRAGLLSPTGVLFSRFGDNLSCATPPPRVYISWERITFNTGAQVQFRVLEIAAGAPTNAVAITPVDATRTLLLTSGQIYGGQGSGETSDTTSNTSSGVGRLSLEPGNAQLRVTRETTSGKGKWTAFAVQFDP